MFSDVHKFIYVYKLILFTNMFVYTVQYIYTIQYFYKLGTVGFQVCTVHVHVRLYVIILL